MPCVTTWTLQIILPHLVTKNIHLWMGKSFITNPMEQSPCWVGNTWSTDLDIPCPQRYSIVFTRADHWTTSWAKWIHSTSLYHCSTIVFEVQVVKLIICCFLCLWGLNILGYPSLFCLDVDRIISSHTHTTKNKIILLSVVPGCLWAETQELNGSKSHLDLIWSYFLCECHINVLMLFQNIFSLSYFQSIY